jgi:hypothetical protein
MGQTVSYATRLPRAVKRHVTDQNRTKKDIDTPLRDYNPNADVSHISHYRWALLRVGPRIPIHNEPWKWL